MWVYRQSEKGIKMLCFLILAKKVFSRFQKKKREIKRKYKQFKYQRKVSTDF